MEIDIQDAIKPPSRNVVRRRRRMEARRPRELPEPVGSDYEPEVKIAKESHEVHDELPPWRACYADEAFKAVISGSILEDHGKLKAQALKTLREKAPVPALKPLKPPAERPESTADPSTWEVISAVVDSGATIAALAPSVGRGYPVEESEASKAGIEYEVANGDTVPNLGQKRLAVVTPEGSLRGYRSEVADVSSPSRVSVSCSPRSTASCLAWGPVRMSISS